MSKCDFRLFDRFSWLINPDPFVGDFRGFLRQSGFRAGGPPAGPVVGPAAGGLESMTGTPTAAPRSAPFAQSPSVKLDSAPEGWRVSAEDAEFQSVVGATTDGWVAVGRSPFFAGQIGSAKCDWRVITPGVELEGRGVETVRELRANFLGGQLTFGSAKRDWRVGAGTTLLQTLAEVSQDRFTINARGAGFDGLLSSSKCDWRLGGANQWGRVEVESDLNGLEFSVAGPVVETKMAAEEGEWVLQARGAEGAAAKLPEVTTRVTSSKCDFRVRFTVEVEGGPTVYVGGFMSAKCDFRFDAVEYMRPGGEFEPLLPEETQTPTTRRKPK